MLESAGGFTAEESLPWPLGFDDEVSTILESATGSVSESFSSSSEEEFSVVVTGFEEASTTLLLESAEGFTTGESVSTSDKGFAVVLGFEEASTILESETGSVSDSESDEESVTCKEASTLESVRGLTTRESVSSSMRLRSWKMQLAEDSSSSL